MILLDDVTKIYQPEGGNQINAVINASLEVLRGEFLVITGRSGSGKTTLLNLISGLTRPTSGRILIEGIDLWTLSDRQQARLRNQKIGFVFQFPSLIPSLTAFENVTLPIVFGANHTQLDAEARASELLEKLGLSDKFSSLPRQLSAGQQQRVVIARALLNQPEVLLADEPTSDLDEQTETEIMDLFKGIHQSTGITIVLVTHSTQLVHYGTRSIRMAGGEIL